MHKYVCMRKNQYILLLCLFFSCISAYSIAQTKVDSLYGERYRPRFHFSPSVNWTNDPNGLIYYAGEYHLYYQYNPQGNSWGHMSWGHAKSTDLVHWKQMPVAIPEEKNYMIFSGSAVADKKNTSGFALSRGQVPIVAMYTAHTDTNQSQHIAYSLDSGKTFTQYSGNPVLDLHKKDFRDPAVMWYAPKQRWIVALVLPDKHVVQFYESRNLKQWKYLSDFGPAGDTTGIWECPQLMQVPLENNPAKKKWVLLLSLSPTMQYFVGDFDGTTFHNENPSDTILRPDYGLDYYAAIAYNNLPYGAKPVTIGWANNWNYANDIPTKPWKSAMSLPRNVSLKKIGEQWVLLQKPIEALDSLRNETYTADTITDVAKDIPIKSQQLEMQFTMHIKDSSVTGVILAYAENRGIIVGYDAANKKLFVDRSKAGNNSFSENFAPKVRRAFSRSSRSFNCPILYEHA